MRLLRLLSRIVAALVACAAVGFVYARYLEPNWVTVSRVRIEHDGLARALGQARIVHVTDLHIERFGFREKSLINQVNWQRPDWIVITGDLINDKQGWPAALYTIGRLQAEHGVWVVLGNTDNAQLGAKDFEAGLRKVGARVLRNARTPFGKTGAWLVGVDDPADRPGHLEQALREFDPKTLPPIVLLAHVPDVLPRASEAGIPVVLAGHTHGGQLGIPWLRRFSDYADRGPYVSGGLYRQGGTTLFVNRGIGSKARPHRFFCPPEVAVIEFIPAKQPALQPSDGTLWLSDFETEEEHAIRWTAAGAYAERSQEHVTHGRHSAKVTFTPSKTASFAMTGFLSRSRARRDWSGYEALAFDLYNPQRNQERLLVQLQSPGRHAYKEELVVPGGSSQHVEIPLRELAAHVNLSHMVQLNFFQWRPTHETTFYLDAVHLRPSAQRAPAPSASPPAAPLPAKIAPSTDWRLSWTSSLVKVLRDPSAFQPTEFPMQVSLARGEYEGAQLVLIGGNRPSNVTVSVGPLTHAAGVARIPERLIQVRRVDYVTTKRPYYAVTHVGEWPDPLPLATESREAGRGNPEPSRGAGAIEVPAKRLQPVWITLGAPSDLPPGRYAGVITVTDDAGRVEHAPLEAQVWDFTLPRTPSLKTAFGWYRGRFEQAYREFVPGGAAWEGKFDELEQRYFLDMLTHRISPIWNADPTVPKFARDVKRYLDYGLTAFGVGLKGGVSGNEWPDDPVKFAQAMVWYRQASFELEAMKLLDQAYVYATDEPALGDPRVPRVFEALHHDAPKLKRLLVLNKLPDPVQHAEWMSRADILCLHMSIFDAARVEAFKRMGKELWMYVSSPAHPYPTLVIDHPAIAPRIIPWMAWKSGASGLLFWVVNYWKQDPWKNPATFANDQNGNGVLYYPSVDGPVPSIRLEVLRDGIEDYEYLHLLGQLLEEARARGVEPGLIAQAARLLTVDPALVESLRNYSKDPQVLLRQRDDIAFVIEKLQRALGRGTPGAGQPSTGTSVSPRPDERLERRSPFPGSAGGTR
jgi:predicted MPP superfamily phosphohydrolase